MFETSSSHFLRDFATREAALNRFGLLDHNSLKVKSYFNEFQA
jgi:hypothetical protein